jgi:hypothetical protein
MANNTIAIRWQHRLARSAWCGTMITVLVVLAGAFGSLYSDEIRSAFPFRWGIGPIGWHAVLFWVTTLSAAVLFFERQRAIELARQASEEQLNRRADALASLVRTLPPAGFLSMFHDLHWECSNVLNSILQLSPDDPAPEKVRQAIRIVLGSLARLAHNFDGRPSLITYASNIMLFRSPGSLSDTERTELRGRLRFVEREIVLAALDGVLDLRVDLSTTITDQGNKPDPGLVPLALPIPSDPRSRDGLRSRVLPGAPKAFWERKLDLYANTATLGKWCRTRGDFSESIAKEIDDYFGRDMGAHLHSFVSFPLGWPDQRPVAVLNIHRNKEGILRATEESVPDTIEHFYAVIGPFRSTLLMLLQVLSLHEAEPRRGS